MFLFQLQIFVFCIELLCYNGYTVHAVHDVHPKYAMFYRN